MPCLTRFAVHAWAALLFCSAAHTSLAHMDAARVSLSQMFLAADLVVIARVVAVEERSFVLDGAPTSYEVVSAEVLSQYKGVEQGEVEFFQDAHGHAHYVPGDIAVLFLEDISGRHPLYEVADAADVKYLSSQVRNTEYRLQPDDIADYEWVLGVYAQPLPITTGEAFQPSSRVKPVLLRMLGSRSQDMVESGLLDWENIGASIEMEEADIEYLSALTRDPSRALNLRLAILRSMFRKDLLEEEEWAYFFDTDNDEELVLIIRSTQGHENKVLQPYLVSLLQHDSTAVVESAGRALGHPGYAGSEAALKPLLYIDNQRLNYAAVAGLLGIDSELASQLLREAQSRHSNSKVRRMIAARMNLNQ